MSPFCRKCLGVAREGELRCPLDQEFYLRRDCPGCGREVYPRELYCAHCGKSLSGAPEALLLPAEAPRLAMALALMLDLLVMTLMVGAQFPVLGPGLILALGLLAACLYRSLARANGRQSFGQAVLHLLTVNREAGPADFGQAARRTLGELALLPLSLLRGQPVLDRLDTWSATYEVRVD